MTAFPEIVIVPRGLVEPRMFWGLTPLVWAMLALLTVVPAVLLGTLCLIPLPLVLGVYIAIESRRDPEFLVVWAGELQFTNRYH